MVGISAKCIIDCLQKSPNNILVFTNYKIEYNAYDDIITVGYRYGRSWHIPQENRWGRFEWDQVQCWSSCFLNDLVDYLKQNFPIELALEVL